MKNILMTAIVVGAIVAVVITLTTEESPLGRTRIRRPRSGEDEVADAAEDAYKTLNKHVGRVERKTEDVIDQAFQLTSSNGIKIKKVLNNRITLRFPLFKTFLMNLLS